MLRKFKGYMVKLVVDWNREVFNVRGRSRERNKEIQRNIEREGGDRDRKRDYLVGEDKEEEVFRMFREG